MRAPLAPIGWPSATAPPLTLTLAGSSPSCAITATSCDRERLVDLEQIDVVQRTSRPSASTRRTASTGVISTYFGARPLVACATMRRDGARRAPARASADASTSAAAPSLTGGALPAVTVPSSLNAGLRRRSASSDVSARTDSSRVDDQRRLPFLLRHVHRQDLASKRPSRCGRRGLLVARRARSDPAPRASRGTRRPPPRRPAPCASARTRTTGRRGSSSRSPRRGPCAALRAPAASRYGASAHRLHAAGHGHVDVAGAMRLRGEHHGLQARAAHLVDGERRHVVGEAGARAPPAAPAPGRGRPTPRCP